MESWHDEFLYMKKTVDWGVLTYTMHPYVIGRGYRMLALEGLVEQARQGRRGVHDDGTGGQGSEQEALWLSCGRATAFPPPCEGGTGRGSKLCPAIASTPPPTPPHKGRGIACT